MTLSTTFSVVSPYDFNKISKDPMVTKVEVIKLGQLVKIWIWSGINRVSKIASDSCCKSDYFSQFSVATLVPFYYCKNAHWHGACLLYCIILFLYGNVKNDPFNTSSFINGILPIRAYIYVK